MFKGKHPVQAGDVRIDPTDGSITVFMRVENCAGFHSRAFYEVDVVELIPPSAEIPQWTKSLSTVIYGADELLKLAVRSGPEVEEGCLVSAAIEVEETFKKQQKEWGRRQRLYYGAKRKRKGKGFV